MAGTVRWARMVVVAADGTHWKVPLAGEGPPDLAFVAALARFQLIVRRAGGRVWLEDVSSPLAELLDLAGLRREVGGQPEGREQALGVQEEVKPNDAAP
ncbi:MAG TPA: hypothetical protein VKD66_20020 [Streptosporangiaceae bacterium]|nr:hypothetical protein [Streptosporangiaceae bacterium]